MCLQKKYYKREKQKPNYSTDISQSNWKEMAEKEPTKLSDLNTDCLLEVFKYLQFEDLTNLKCVHAAFGDALDHIASTKKFKLCLNLYGFGDADNYNIYNASNSLNAVERYLKTFGRVVQNLNIATNDSQHNTINLQKNVFCTNLIRNYCVNGDVKTCAFANFDLSETFLVEHTEFLLALRSLEMVNSVFIGSKIGRLLDCLADSHEIRKLKISGVRVITESNIFPKIAKSQLVTCIIDIGLSIDHERIDDVIVGVPFNETLKQLDLGDSLYDPVVLLHFPNIETLRYPLHGEYELQPIVAMPNLKKLVLINWISSMDAFLAFMQDLAAKNQLDVIYFETNLHGFFAAEHALVDILIRMSNLRDLKLWSGFKYRRNLSFIGEHLLAIECLRCQKRLRNAEIVAVLDFLKNTENLVVLELDIANKAIGIFYETAVEIREKQMNGKVLFVRLLNCTPEAIGGTFGHGEYVKILKN